MPDRDNVLRKVIKALNGSIDTLSKLERDPPIVPIANLEREGIFRETGLEETGREALKVAYMLNSYKREYWVLEQLIRQSFMDTMNKRGYLPGRSVEVESLRNALPEALIKGDGRIWTYSYDHYIDQISQKVGRPAEKAPSGDEVWELTESRFMKRIDNIVERANRVLPEVFHLKSRLRPLIGDPEKDISEVHVKKQKITLVERPITKVIVVKRPIPLPKKGRVPRKRILKKPKHHVIGPEGGS